MIYLLTQFIGITFVILTIIWAAVYLGLVVETSDIRLFNWHPILMGLGMIYIYGNCKFYFLLNRYTLNFLFFSAILFFRVFKSSSKLTVKTLHGIFHAISIILLIFGLSVELISHYHHGEMDFHSLHSWIGLLSIIIFFCQFFFGFVCYFSPFVMSKVKAFYLPIHVFFGCFCFVLAVGASLIGLNETAMFDRSYHFELTGEGILINIIGLLIVIFAGLVIFLATKGSFKRVSRENEDINHN